MLDQKLCPGHTEARHVAIGPHMFTSTPSVSNWGTVAEHVTKYYAIPDRDGPQRGKLYSIEKSHCTQNNGCSEYRVRGKTGHGLNTSQSTTTEGTREKARIVYGQNLISLNRSMNPVLKMPLKCAICFSISFRWYAFPNFCAPISRPLAYGVRTSTKASATAALTSKQGVVFGTLKALFDSVNGDAISIDQELSPGHTEARHIAIWGRIVFQAVWKSTTHVESLIISRTGLQRRAGRAGEGRLGRREQHILLRRMITVIICQTPLKWS